MKRLLVGALLAACGVAAAQGHPGEDEREEALFGTPQKTPDGGVYLGEPDAGISTPLGTTGAQTPEPEASPGRPAEEDLFGGGEQPQPPAAEVVEEQLEAPRTQDERGLQGGIVDRFATGDYVEDPLDIGGLYYQRFSSTTREGSGLSNTLLSAPTLVDVYFDARPNDRLRAMAVARLQYDPLLSEGAFADQVLGRQRDNPSISLDQLWLRFDIARVVFVTAGRQHVKWGAGRFWNPTDYLHPVRRDALALFDVRVGTNMVKLHVPVESNGANFYAIAVLDNPYSGGGTLKDVGGAFRAEWVLGNTEVGIDGIVQNGIRPRYGLDVSSALGPLDVYGELALRSGPYERFALTDAPFGPGFERTQEGDYALAVTGGANWTFAYSESDTATVGAEYFYNPSGYDDPDLYPLLIFNGAFQPFYVGQQYAALYALVAGPGSWDKTSFVLSNLANLSDRSFVSRLDFTVRVLTHLTVEANASVFYGAPQGEFRLRLNVPPTQVNGQLIPAFTVPAQRFAVGLGLRLDI